MEIGVYAANDTMESAWLGHVVAHHSLRSIQHDTEWMFGSDGIVCHPLGEYATELRASVHVGKISLWAPMIVEFMNAMEAQGWTADNYESTGLRNCISFTRAVLASWNLTIPSSWHLTTSAALYDTVRRFTSRPAPDPICCRLGLPSDEEDWPLAVKFIDKANFGGKRWVHLRGKMVLANVFSKRLSNPNTMKHLAWHDRKLIKVELTRHKTQCPPARRVIKVFLK